MQTASFLPPVPSASARYAATSGSSSARRRLPVLPPLILSLRVDHLFDAAQVAAVAYLLALAVGVACSVLIALVVVTFDEATTEAWLIGTLMSVSRSCR